ncbi:MAG TPA: LysM peptidoglycan-binding domain-containing protein [Thermomicrobiales bacterium]|nr:LysM peptidoglycan-binding domain-containing protein [Thermomicrobiales bacterium]
MTIVLGRRPAIEQINPADVRKAEWVARFSTGARQQEIPTGPPPVPMAEVRMHMPAVDASGRPQRLSRPDGLVGLYATRIDVQRAQRMTTGRKIRLAAGSRPCTVVRETVTMGRGCPEHYQRLYPARRPALRRLRHGGEFMSPSSVSQSVRNRIDAMRPQFGPGSWRELLAASFRYSRLSAPRRTVMASMAALIILAGAATSTLAQQRYEVQPGDTLESIAAEFGVDPEGIYRSSYMPNGWSVEAGQVIVIPDQGQSPAEAAAMAAQLEGTSPWVMGAHWVEYGDTLGSIGQAWGVAPDVLMSFNGIADPTQLVPGQRILIPYEREDQTVSTLALRTPDVAVPVANYSQSRNLSCEYAAAHAATTAFGAGIGEQTFISSVPQANNPHYGYRGNIDGWWGNTDDYGVYAEALVPTLNANGYAGEVMYTEGDTAPLVAHLDAGHPVVVWLGFWGDMREVLTDQDHYSVFAGMHVVTVYGYDTEGVYVMDPAKGTTQYYDLATFQQLWSVIDGMGLAVYAM